MVSNFISNNGPAFDEKIYVTRPNLPTSEELLPMISGMLHKRWVTNFGDCHNELTKKLEKALDVKHVILCCNGSIGLFLLLKALELKGRVITTAFTFPATIHAIQMAGLEPVFCDIDPDEYTLSPESVRQKIDHTISAILSVNVFGNASDVEALRVIGEEFKIPVLYDSAHAFFSSYKGRKLGSFGTAEMFSFHATKLFTTLEGGAITTNDEDLSRKLRLLINFGIRDEEHVVDIGLNAKMSEMNAIFGILSLKNVRAIVEKLAELSHVYKKRLCRIPGITCQKVRPGCISNNQYMPVEIDHGPFGLSRDELHFVLKKDNIIARKYFYPSGEQYECYKNMDFARSAIIPNTRRVSDRILCLPIYNALTADDVEKICDVIESIHNDRDGIRKRLEDAEYRFVKE